MVRLKVIVYFDYGCPFCFIAKNLMDRLRGEFDIAVEWKGFLVHPEIPAGGVDLKYLGGEKSRILFARMQVVVLADHLGIRMKFPQRLFSSRSAFVLGQLAVEQGRFAEFHDAVFRAHWEEGIDIGDEVFLQGIVKRLGLDPSLATDYLHGPKSEDICNQMMVEAQEKGVDGAPTFLIGNIARVVGVQPYEFFVRAVEKGLEQNKHSEKTASYSENCNHSV